MRLNPEGMKMTDLVGKVSKVSMSVEQWPSGISCVGVLARDIMEAEIVIRADISYCSGKFRIQSSPVEEQIEHAVNSVLCGNYFTDVSKLEQDNARLSAALEEAELSLRKVARKLLKMSKKL